MPPTVQDLGLDRLSRADWLALVQDIWDSIAEEGLALISDARRESERQADDDKSPDDLIPWEQVKAQTRAVPGSNHELTRLVP